LERLPQDWTRADEQLKKLKTQVRKSAAQAKRSEESAVKQAIAQGLVTSLTTGAPPKLSHAELRQLQEVHYH
jgi:FKBP-type peptidyl-prolyl cis-trans isomerase (trigger factor)